MSSTTYQMHGLSFHSELELPADSQPSKPDPHVVIRRGPVPPSLESAVERGVLYQASPEAYLLDVQDVSRFLVRDGREITVHGEVSSRPLPFLLGPCLGAMAHQIELLPLDGSAVTDGSDALLLVGQSGVGKSTLAAAFCRRGFTLISDDLCILHKGGRVYPGPRGLKLQRRVAERLGFHPDTIRANPSGGLLDWVPVDAVDPGRSYRVRWVVRVRVWNRHEVCLEERRGQHRFSALLSATHRLSMLKALGREQAHFVNLNAVPKDIPVWDLRHRADMGLLDEMVDRIRDEVMLRAPRPAV